MAEVLRLNNTNFTIPNNRYLNVWSEQNPQHLGFDDDLIKLLVE